MISKIDFNLFCSECETSHFVMLPGFEVSVTVDLQSDEYVFKAICPECDKVIENRRRM